MSRTKKTKTVTNGSNNIPVDSWNPAVLNDALRSGKMGSGGESVLPEIDVSDYGSYLAVDENGKWGLDIPKTGIELKKITWTGAGGTGHAITFENVPTIILTISGQAAGGSRLSTIPFVYGESSMGSLNLTNSASAVPSYLGVTYSDDHKTMNISSNDVDIMGYEYNMYYI